MCQQRIRKMFYYSEWNEKTTKIVLFREKFIFVDNFHIYSTLFSAISIFLPSIMTIKYLKNIKLWMIMIWKKSWYTFLPKWYESEMCVYSVFIRDTALSILLAPLHIMYVLFSFVQKNGKRFRRKFSGNGKKCTTQSHFCNFIHKLCNLLKCSSILMRTVYYYDVFR